MIVGGGLTGLITSILLRTRFPNTSVRLVEKGSFPAGASVKNAGFACYGSVSEILDDISREGEEAAIRRVKERYQGLQQLRYLTHDKDIDYRADGGFEVFSENEEDIYLHSLQAILYLNDLLRGPLGFDPFSETGNPFGIKALPKLIAIAGEAALHSGKLLASLLLQAQELGVITCFGCDVQSIEKASSGWETLTAEGVFQSEKVILTTNGFTHSLLPEEPILPYRGQLVLTAPVPGLSLSGNFHLKQGYFYFRPYQGGILLGGGRHLDRANENTESQEATAVIQDALEELLRTTILPGQSFSIKERWAGTMAFGPQNEKEAIVKEVRPGYYLGARLGGMGVAMAPQVARKMVELSMS